MDKILVTLLLSALGTASLAGQEILSLRSFEQPVRAEIQGGKLAWIFPGHGFEDSPGHVEWLGSAPTQLRALRSVTLPDGNLGVAVLGFRDGRDSLFLLEPVWGGLRQQGGAWLSAPASETLTAYSYQYSSDSVVLAAWTSQSLVVSMGNDSSGFVSGSAAFLAGSAALIKLVPFSEDGSHWAILAASLTSQGWAPQLWTLSDGRLVLGAQGQSTAALTSDAPTVSVTSPVSGKFSIILSQPAVSVIWSWLGGSVQPLIVQTLPSPSRGQAVGDPDEPAFFWWVENGRAAGLATRRLGQGSTAWSQNLPGPLLWSSKPFFRSEGWRIWLVLDAAQPLLYRLDVRSDGFSDLSRAGDLAAGTSVLSLTPGPTWTVASGDHRWSLDPETPKLTPETAPWEN